MIAAKHALDPGLFHRTISGPGMVPCQLFPNGRDRPPLRSPIWDQSIISLDDRLKLPVFIPKLSDTIHDRCPYLV